MTPSVSAAIRLAQQNPARAQAMAEFARLMWHVPAWEGGFEGADDSLLEERAKRYGLTAEQVSAGLHVRGTWPNSIPAKQAEAA